MAESDRYLRVGYLNVVATPHPTGVYERLFRAIANTPTKFWGDNTAAITPIRARTGAEYLFTGQILTWVEIDPRSPAVDKRRLEEVALSPDARRLTNALGFNSKVFRFVLDTSNHIISFESRNESEQRLSPRRAQSIFERLLSPNLLGPQAETVDVTIMPEDDALARVLNIGRLDRVTIVIKRPNADDVTDETHEVLADLAAQNAKREEITLIRAPQTDGLELSGTNQKLARVASHNGHVTAKGRRADGEPDVRSTKEYPKVDEILVPAGTTFLSRLADAALALRPRRPRR